MTRHLHVSLGPVQGFVAQARRTRDLWGGSYLLSLLAAHAMCGARAAGGAIVRPRVDEDPLLRWVESSAGAPPQLGSLPNQFTVELGDHTDPRSVAEAAGRAFRAAWQRACDAVWTSHVAPLASRGVDTEAIWRRQTDGFWELVWVAGGPDDRGLLGRRKQWRTHSLPEEGGDKCTVMPELQEVSGHVRTIERGRVKQDAFWSELRDRLGPLELRERERLCAIALVKRLYARVASRAVGGELDVTRWPSTIDVAAVLWLRRALEIAPAELDAHARAVITGTTEAVQTGGVSSLLAEARPGTRIGASWYHRSFVASPRLAPLRDEGARAALLAGLRALTDAPDGHGGTLGGPPIYYALLLADGDQLGERVAELGGEAVSRALAAFTAKVPDIVRSHVGVPVYAGGDDVLALLPVENALACARSLEQAFRRAFGDAAATLSAAVVLAHGRSPLQRVLAEARRLLNDVAKDGNGRDSVAVAVHRGDATAVQWVSTWERASTGAARKAATACLDDAVREMAPGRGRLSTSLLHDVRRLLGLLGGESSTSPGAFTEIPGEIDVGALVKAEIEHRLGKQCTVHAPEELARLTAILDDLLSRARRDDRPALEGERAPRSLGIDGLALASFLASGGREDDHWP